MTVSNIEVVLAELKAMDEIDMALVISRSGMHIAGEIPDHVHAETFVAMSAILLGAAETATSEMKGDLSHVEIHLGKKTMVLTDTGKKGLLVVSIDGAVTPETLNKLKEHAKELVRVM